MNEKVERYDCHTHIMNPNMNPEDLMQSLRLAKLSGACVFSQAPVSYTHLPNTAEYEERVSNLLQIVKADKKRLFPILWLHPDEPDVTEHMEDAVKRGVLGFKMICNNYFVYEKKSMRILECAAKLGKPVFFHSGILWDGAVSSIYNKPINWEACLEIPGLKFSMGHCSWPWHDECLALYGKFLNAYTYRPELSAEMFLDITPGTPRIYREELLTKIFTIGYDVKHNIMFGTDCNAEEYHTDWSLQWQQTDDAIYEKLFVDEETKSLIYGGNLKHFLGIAEEEIKRKITKSDGTVAEV